MKPAFWEAASGVMLLRLTPTFSTPALQLTEVDRNSTPAAMTRWVNFHDLYFHDLYALAVLLGVAPGDRAAQAGAARTRT